MVIVVPDISVDGRRFGSVPEPPSNPPTYIDIANALRLSTHLVHQYTSKLGAVLTLLVLKMRAGRWCCSS